MLRKIEPHLRRVLLRVKTLGSSLALCIVFSHVLHVPYRTTASCFFFFLLNRLIVGRLPMHLYLDVPYRTRCTTPYNTFFRIGFGKLCLLVWTLFECRRTMPYSTFFHVDTITPSPRPCLCFQTTRCVRRCTGSPPQGAAVSR